MASRVLFRLSTAVLLVILASACGPRETPEQHLARLRNGHDIIPVGVIPATEPDGSPKMIVDLRITNKTSEQLDHLTVLVRVTGADGSEKLLKPMTLDLSDSRQGVGIQLAAVVHNFQLAEDDQVSVEIARNLSPEELRALPEFQDLQKKQG